MKKLVLLAIVLLLLLVSVSAVSAAPWNNPNGYWLYDVDCGAHGIFDVFVANDNADASFNDLGEVGVMKSLYYFDGSSWQPVRQNPGVGVYKNTTWCQFEVPEVGLMGGFVLIR